MGNCLCCSRDESEVGLIDFADNHYVSQMAINYGSVMSKPVDIYRGTISKRDIEKEEEDIFYSLPDSSSFRVG